MEGLKLAYTSETRNSQRKRRQFDRTDGLGDSDMQCLSMAGKKSGKSVRKVDWQKYINNGTLAAWRICSSCLQLSRIQVFQEVLYEGAHR